MLYVIKRKRKRMASKKRKSSAPRASKRQRPEKKVLAQDEARFSDFEQDKFDNKDETAQPIDIPSPEKLKILRKGHQELEKKFDRLLERLVNPIGHPPSTEDERTFQDWLLHNTITFCNDTRKRLISLNASVRYIDILTAFQTTNEAEQKLWDKVKKTKIMHGNKQNFLRAMINLAVLTSKDRANPLRNIRSLSKDQTIAWCFTYCIVVQPRLLILKHFKASLQLEYVTEHQRVLNDAEQRYTEMRQSCGLKKNASLYRLFEFETALGTDLENISTLSAPEIKQAIYKLKSVASDGVRFPIEVLSCILVHQNNTSLLEQVKLELKGCKNKDLFIDHRRRFVGNSQWRNDLYERLKEDRKITARGRSAYPEKLIAQTMQDICRQFSHIQDYAAENYTIPKGEDVFKWFMENAHEQDVFDVTLSYGKAVTVHNEYVKRNNPQHPSHHRVNEMLRLFRAGVGGALVDKDAALKLDGKKILAKIPNTREKPKTARKTLTDEQYAKMEDAVRDDVRWKLILTILREIGLRKGAIQHMTYSILFDKDHEPMNTFTVREKNDCIRSCATSKKLRLLMHDYGEELRAKFPDLNPKTFYVFGYKNHDSAPTNLEDGIKSIAKLAGISEEVHVHPHLFRHTLVGKMMRAGNTIDQVSKFMGHANAAITSSAYWVESSADVARRMNNPFLNPKPTTADDSEMKNEILTLANQKVDIALKIIRTYNLQISMFMKKDPKFKELKDSIFDSIPNLGELLQTLAQHIPDEAESISSDFSTFTRD
jgi:integrase